MTDRAALEEEREFLLGEIRRLDSELAAGVLSSEEHRSLRDQQTVRAAEVIRRLDRPDDVPVEIGEVLPARKAKPVGKPRPRWVWIAATAAFVLLAGGAVLGASGQREFGEGSTGDIVADSNTLLARARQQTGEGRADQAVRTYDQVLRIDPNNVEALAYRGWLVRLAGLPAEGLASIDRAIAIDPDYPDARFFKGFILLRDRQQPAAAVPEFEAFLANDPPAELVPLVQQALADARAQSAGKPAVD